MKQIERDPEHNNMDRNEAATLKKSRGENGPTKIDKAS